MKGNRNKINRRNFLKTIGAAGVGSVFVSAQIKADPNEPNTPGKTQKPKFPQVPRRKLGTTGVEVSCLALGGGLSFVDSKIILRKALERGINYWDTSHIYAGSERGIGAFLLKNPRARKELFIATKASGANNVVTEIEKRLQTSLERINTKYVDLYYGGHEISDPAQLTVELKQWAQSAKKRKLIRFFGFSTHSNMAKCLAAAAKVGWIDAIITKYNFRLMNDAKMQAAVEACHKTGVGLTAMKTQARGQKFEAEEDKKLAKHFLQRGFTEGQAKIKVVLEDKRFSSACVRMGNIALLTSNVAAVLDKTKLTQTDKKVLAEYAKATCSGYCASCAYICDKALPDIPYVSDIMRYLMYCNSYGEKDRARELFAQIPDEIGNRLLSTNYGAAEARCPQHLPIGKLIAEAVSKLA